MNQFQVIERDRCIIVVGHLSLDGLRGITAMAPKGAIMSPTLARMLGANFATGLPEDITALIGAIKPEVEKATRAKLAGTHLSAGAVSWLAGGERGTSSNSIFTFLTGVDALEGWSSDHPHDPDDLRRCRLLLERCPEIAERFQLMRGASKAWGRLVDAWQAICAEFDKEAPPEWRDPKCHWRAPRTYNLIKTTIDPK